jgi:hypothetical protein
MVKHLESDNNKTSINLPSHRKQIFKIQDIITLWHSQPLSKDHLAHMHGPELCMQSHQVASLEL